MSQPCAMMIFIGKNDPIRLLGHTVFLGYVKNILCFILVTHMVTWWDLKSSQINENLIQDGVFLFVLLVLFQVSAYFTINLLLRAFDTFHNRLVDIRLKILHLMKWHAIQCHLYVSFTFLSYWLQNVLWLKVREKWKNAWIS